MRGPSIEFRYPTELVGGDTRRREAFVSRLTLATRRRHPNASRISVRACSMSRGLSVRVSLPGLDRFALMHELALVLLGDKVAAGLDAN